MERYRWSTRESVKVSATVVLAGNWRSTLMAVWRMYGARSEGSFMVIVCGSALSWLNTGMVGKKSGLITMYCAWLAPLYRMVCSV